MPPGICPLHFLWHPQHSTSALEPCEFFTFLCPLLAGKINRPRAPHLIQTALRPKWMLLLWVWRQCYIITYATPANLTLFSHKRHTNKSRLAPFMSVRVMRWPGGRGGAGTRSSRGKKKQEKLLEHPATFGRFNYREADSCGQRKPITTCWCYCADLQFSKLNFSDWFRKWIESFNIFGGF